VMRKCACVPQPCVVNVGLGLAAAVTAALRLSFAVHLFGTQICGCSLSASRNKTPTTQQTPRKMQKHARCDIRELCWPAVHSRIHPAGSGRQSRGRSWCRGWPFHQHQRSVRGPLKRPLQLTSEIGIPHPQTPCSALPYKPIFCV
jgi:hypothetical protein